jgi:hypothetical protein
MQTEPIPTPYFNQGPKAAGAAAGEVSRRALLVTAGLGVCAAGVVATPIALKYAEDQAAKALQDGIHQGIEQGKDAALGALDTVGEISLEAAIGVAEVTKLGIKYILQPLASFAAFVGGDALQALISGVDGVRNAANIIGYHNDALDRFSQTLHTWHDNLSNLPISLANYATTDVNSAETYLKALKVQVDAAKAKIGQNSATPTPTPTP